MTYTVSSGTLNLTLLLHIHKLFQYRYLHQNAIGRCWKTGNKRRLVEVSEYGASDAHSDLISIVQVLNVWHRKTKFQLAVIGIQESFI